jgi:hypothetical protein
MIAAIHAESPQRFRDFQFLFALMFVHKAGAHLLITSINNGRTITPPQITAHGFGNDRWGESGCYLEMSMFGGTMEFYRDLAQNDGQVRYTFALRLFRCLISKLDWNTASTRQPASCVAD